MGSVRENGRETGKFSEKQGLSGHFAGDWPRLAADLAAALDDTWIFMFIAATTSANQCRTPMHRTHAEMLARVHRVMTDAHAAGLLPAVPTSRLPAILAEHGYDLDNLLLPTPSKKGQPHG